MKKTGTIKYCLKCKKEFYVPLWLELSGKGKFCSKICSDLGKKRSFLHPRHSSHKGDHEWLNSGCYKAGHKHTEETKIKMKLAKLGKKNNSSVLVEYYKDNEVWNKNKKMGPMSKEQRKKISIANRGEKSYLWKGGITKINTLIRMGLEYRLWRESVFKRDNWTCQICKIRGEKLQAHHIKPFALNPDSRFDTNNGITLCKNCHKLTDSYLNINYSKNNYART